MEYEAVGGIGVKVTSDMVHQLINNDVFTEGQYKENPYECIEALKIPYNVTGSAYSGDNVFYLMVDGGNLEEVNENSGVFIDNLRSYGIDLKVSDLMVICEYYVS